VSEVFYACICEGAAEEVVINILLDAQKLKFSREDLLEEKVIRCRMAKKFEEHYLRKHFNKKLTILRILDSKNENFKLREIYRKKVDVIDVVTSPEIEMLVIINEGKYEEYQKYKSTLRPSEYCTDKLGMKSVKNSKFLYMYFSDVDKLVNAIKIYKSKTKIDNRKKCLADLLISE